jgi:hypothetical protein
MRFLGRPAVSPRRGLDTQASRTEWQRLVSLSNPTAETQGPKNLW